MPLNVSQFVIPFGMFVFLCANLWPSSSAQITRMNIVYIPAPVLRLSFGDQAHLGKLWQFSFMLTSDFNWHLFNSFSEIDQDLQVERTQ